MRKLFITGGAGFIGSAFIRMALKELPDSRITNFDALTYAGNPDNLADINSEEGYHFVQGDIADREAVLAALEPDTDFVINFAAESHVDRSINSTESFLHTNIIGTQVLLDAARERAARRFIQISTDEVMGSIDEDEGGFFTESSPVAPNNPYAASKAAAEHLVRAAHRTFGLDAVITRSGNNYGPYQYPEKFLALVITNALEEQSIPIYGDGKQVRDWIYVDDHCRAILELLDKGKPGQVYNIGARNQQRNLDVAQAVLNELGKPLALIRHVKDRPGHDRRYAIDPTKLERETGWRPQQPWETGLLWTIQWYMEHTEWVRRARSAHYREYVKRQYGVLTGLES